VLYDTTLYDTQILICACQKPCVANLVLHTRLKENTNGKMKCKKIKMPEKITFIRRVPIRVTLSQRSLYIVTVITYQASRKLILRWLTI